MLGSADNPGITFKTVMELYKRINVLHDKRQIHKSSVSVILPLKLQEKVEECSCEIAVSYLEVYKQTIVDLINQSSGQLNIRDDGQNAINIPGLSIHKPSGPDELQLVYGALEEELQLVDGTLEEKLPRVGGALLQLPLAP